MLKFVCFHDAFGYYFRSHKDTYTCTNIYVVHKGDNEGIDI